jgi:hypothetical protein
MFDGRTLVLSGVLFVMAFASMHCMLPNLAHATGYEDAIDAAQEAAATAEAARQAADGARTPIDDAARKQAAATIEAARIQARGLVEAAARGAADAAHYRQQEARDSARLEYEAAKRTWCQDNFAELTQDYERHKCFAVGVYH